MVPPPKPRCPWERWEVDFGQGKKYFKASGRFLARLEELEITGRASPIKEYSLLERLPLCWLFLLVNYASVCNHYRKIRNTNKQKEKKKLPEILPHKGDISPSRHFAMQIHMNKNILYVHNC